MSEFDIKGFVVDALALDPSMKSTDIAKFLQSKGHNITWQTIAGIRGKLKI